MASTGTSTKKRGAGSKTSSRKTAARKTTAARPSRQSDGKLSCRQAVTKVLEKATEPMTAKAVIDAVLALPNHRIGGKTPRATVASELYTGAKPEKGRYELVSKGLFQIAQAPSAATPAKAE